MLYNEMRPHTFDDVVGQNETVDNIRKQSIKNKFFQVYILGGQFGSGKTTIARIIALAANCRHKDENGNPCMECPECQEILSGASMDVIEIDAASNTGVDSIRDLKETVEYLPVNLDKKVYIIDEVHMLSTGAFNALLKVLEEPPKHVMFILCTTEVKKIPATVRSRAASYQFRQITKEEMIPHLKKVADIKNYSVTEDALTLISKNSQGAMRNALSLLEQSAEMGDVTVEVVSTMLGISDPRYLFGLLKNLLAADKELAINSVNELFAGGKNPFLMVGDLLDICADCIMAFYTGAENVNGTESYSQMVSEIVSISSSDVLCAITDNLMVIRDELRKMPEKTTLVCGIIRMLSDDKGAVLNAKIRELEERLLQVENGQKAGVSEQINNVNNELREQATEDTDNSACVDGVVHSDTVSESVSDTVSDTENNLDTYSDSVSEEDAYAAKVSDADFDAYAESITEADYDKFADEPSYDDAKLLQEASMLFEKKKETVSNKSPVSTEKVSEDEEKKDNKVDDVKDIKEDEVKETASETATFMTDDPFSDLNSLFAADMFLFPNEPSTPSSEPSNMPSEKVAGNDTMNNETEEVSNNASEQEIKEFIEEFGREYPVVPNMLITACEKTISDTGEVIYTTEHEPVYKLLRTYEEYTENGKYPFSYILNA